MYKLYINSPHIYFIDYFYKSKILEINYYKNGTYRYKNVPYIEYQRLVVARDKQHHIDQYVTGRYVSIKSM